MASKMLDSGAVSAFCGSVATMLGAGMQLDEAIHLLSENRQKSYFRKVCDQLYHQIVAGQPLSMAMVYTSAFPDRAVSMVAIGEHSGHLESVLRSLDIFYGEEDRAFQKIISSVTYPAALLSIMAIILAVTVAVILPVFTSVYENMAGSLTANSSGMATVSLIIGWVAFGLTVVCAVVAIIMAIASRSTGGRHWILSLFSHLPPTKLSMYELALSRFTSSLSVYVAAGVGSDYAMREALKTVYHKKLRRRLERALNLMEDPRNPHSLTQALIEADVVDPFYAHMLNVGAHAGSVDVTLSSMSATLFEDSTMLLDRALDRVEPMLAALLTLAVGATLISIMLPLIGIMGSIG